MVVAMSKKREMTRFGLKDSAPMVKNSMIASTIRRSQRNLASGVIHRKNIEQMTAQGFSKRDLYAAGLKQGRLGLANNLADVLYNVFGSGLGRAIVIEESNRHILLRVDECLLKNSSDGSSCSFVAGYLAGALMSTGKYRIVEVARNTGEKCTEGSCLFLANLDY